MDAPDGGVDADHVPPDAGVDAAPADFAVLWPAETPSEVQPGQLVVLELVGAPAEDLVAEVAGAAATVARLETTQLVFVVPPLAPGGHELIVRAGPLQASVGFSLLAYEPIAAPGELLAERLAGLEDELAELENDPSLAGHADAFADMRGWLDLFAERLAELSPAEQAVVAHALRAAEQDATAAKLAGGFLPECNEALGDYGQALGRAKFAGPVAGLGAMLLAPASVAVLPVLAVGVAAGVAVTAAVTWWKARRALETIVPRVVDRCVVDVGMRIIGNNKLASADTLAFKHGQARLLAIETEVQLEPDVVDQLEAGADELAAAANRLPSSWVPELGEHDGEPEWREGPPHDLELVVDEPNVHGELRIVDKSIELRFAFLHTATAPGESWPFFFALAPASAPELAAHHTAMLDPPVYRLTMADGSTPPVPLVFVSDETQHFRLVADVEGVVIDHHDVELGSDYFGKMQVERTSAGFSVTFPKTSPISFVQRANEPTYFVAAYGHQYVQPATEVRQKTAYELGYKAYIGNSPSQPFVELACGKKLTIPTNAQIWPVLTRNGQTSSMSGSHIFQGTPGPTDKPIGVQTIELADPALPEMLFTCPVDVTLSNEAYRKLVGATIVYRKDGVATYRFQLTGYLQGTVTRLQDGLVLNIQWNLASTFNYRFSCPSGSRSLVAYVDLGGGFTTAHPHGFHLEAGGAPFACSPSTTGFVMQ